MEITLNALAGKIGGTVIGNGEVVIRGIAPIADAGETDITFIANPKYMRMLKTTRACAVIMPPGADSEGRNLLLHPNSYLAFARAIDLFHPPVPLSEKGVQQGAHVDVSASVADSATIFPGAFVSSGASIGRGTVLHPGVFVGRNAMIGADCVLFANCVVYDSTEIGDRVILHGGVVVGSDGFGYARDRGVSVKIRQVGKVVIEDDVEIGAGCAIDRAVLGETRIGHGTKIDNLVQIGHNVRIGADSLIVAQVGISGSTVIGSKVTLAGQVGVAGHIRIGDGVEVGAKSGVVDDIQDNEKVLGLPAIPLAEARKVLLVTRTLPEMRRTLRDLERKVAELEKKTGASGE